jgi:hypothetical protein
MAEVFKRVKCGNVTDALIAATEHAEDMEHVLIIYEAKGEDPGGMICDDSLDVKTANYIIDQFKAYIFRHIKEFD